MSEGFFTLPVVKISWKDSCNGDIAKSYMDVMNVCFILTLLPLILKRQTGLDGCWWNETCVFCLEAGVSRLIFQKEVNCRQLRMTWLWSEDEGNCQMLSIPSNFTAAWLYNGYETFRSDRGAWKNANHWSSTMRYVYHRSFDLIQQSIPISIFMTKRIILFWSNESWYIGWGKRDHGNMQHQDFPVSRWKQNYVYGYVFHYLITEKKKLILVNAWKITGDIQYWWGRRPYGIDHLRLGSLGYVSGVFPQSCRMAHAPPSFIRCIYLEKGNYDHWMAGLMCAAIYLTLMFALPTCTEWTRKQRRLAEIAES